MRRRIAILLATISALAVMGFGMAMGANAHADTAATVRAVTARCNSLEQAKKAGYVRFYVCAEQPGVGTMGQHYVNFDLVGDPTIDARPKRPRPFRPRPRNATMKARTATTTKAAAGMYRVSDAPRIP